MPKPFPMNLKGFHKFGDLLGIEFTKFEEGYSQCALRINENHFNPHKVVHGGVLYSMADTGMGAALYSLLENDELCATVEIKISYFKSVKEGTILCDTKVIHKGKSIGSLESEIKKEGLLVAKAYGTFSIFKVEKIQKK
ncbi:MAG: PaaI family thioesterase [Promethearchaeota archaeon]